MTSPRRILLVDDDHDILKGTSLRLRAAGYDTVSACDGNQGVAAAITHQPDAILMDVRMPNMDGLDALERLQQCEQTEDIPIVMLSASLVDQQAALDAGARFYLTKPYDSKTLLAAIASATNQSTHAENGES